MADDRPQIYLITPPQIEIETFPDLLARVLDTAPVACVRIDLATRDETQLVRAADALRAVTEPRDVALVLRDNWNIAHRTGLDGVHLGDGARNVRAARKALGADAIVGVFAGTSRHEGMNAGEAGADYVAFGPCGGAVPDAGALAQDELFTWWSEMIELPVVAEGGLPEERLATLRDITDFVAFGEEVWSDATPEARLAAIVAQLG